MPLLQINTNINVAEIDQLATDASKLIAGLLGKPESYVMISVTDKSTLLFAGTAEPAAHLKLKSLGLDEDATTAYSETLCQFINEKLDIPGSRIYIEFFNPDRHLWGWDDGTF